MTEGQIAIMKEMVKLSLSDCGIWWIDDPSAPCRKITRIGKAPCGDGNEPEPDEVAFLEGPGGKYLALSEMDYTEFVFGSRLLPKYFDPSLLPDSTLSNELISEEIPQ